MKLGGIIIAAIAIYVVGVTIVGPLWHDAFGTMAHLAFVFATR